MELRSARLTGDPVLRDCLNGNHRMMSPEDNLSVMRLQSALLDLGRSVGPAGADGKFGPDTGAAVTAYKTFKGISPNDPVVGPQTTQALDNDLFFDPPTLDPTFAEFSPAVVNRRLEQFVARELMALLHAPLDSWRHMLGIFALNALNSGELLGIVATSRAEDLRAPYLAVADAIQTIPGTGDQFFANDYFNNGINTAGTDGKTVIFFVGGQPRAFIVLPDEVILGRASIVDNQTNKRAPVTLQGVIVHELTHVRNMASTLNLVTTLDTDTTVYADTALAQASSASGTPTSFVLNAYVSELVARHVHWVVLQELAGTPGNIAILGLQDEKLAGAALFYLEDMGVIYDLNGYGTGILTQGLSKQYEQLNLWLLQCANQSFSDDPAADQQSTLAFQAAAQCCADQVPNPVLIIDQDGVVPLFQDFQ